MTVAWQGIDVSPVIRSVSGTAWRLVENQENIATIAIVDSLEEQAILEELLETCSKPEYRAESSSLHYLLATPFRYPPLRHGSRFGSRFEPGLLYAGLSESVTLAESAYYRLYFFLDMETPPPDGKIRSQHTLFSFRYRSDQGVQLQHDPFSEYQDVLRHPKDYCDSQALGSALREAGVLAFEYLSARDPLAGVNVGMFEPAALSSKKLVQQKFCMAETTNTSVSFSIDRTIFQFFADSLFHEGRFPFPAD